MTLKRKEKIEVVKKVGKTFERIEMFPLSLSKFVQSKINENSFQYHLELNRYQLGQPSTMDVV